MKFKLIFVVLLIISSCAVSKKNKDIDGVYDIACGTCIYGMTGDECDLAVLIDGKKYYVDGSNIDDHGDEHAEDGLCVKSRKAEIKGKIKYGVFMADRVKILPE